jgi:hypothetical protein
MRPPGNEHEHDDSESRLARRRVVNRIEFLRRQRSDCPVAKLREPVVPRAYARFKRLYAPGTARELATQESIVTALAWLVMAGVLVALIYVVFAAYRYAHAL